MTSYPRELNSASRETEAAVGLAHIIAIYRHYKTTNADELNLFKG